MKTKPGLGNKRAVCPSGCHHQSVEQQQLDSFVYYYRIITVFLVESSLVCIKKTKQKITSFHFQTKTITSKNALKLVEMPSE